MQSDAPTFLAYDGWVEDLEVLSTMGLNSFAGARRLKDAIKRPPKPPTKKEDLQEMKRQCRDIANKAGYRIGDIEFKRVVARSLLVLLEIAEEKT